MIFLYFVLFKVNELYLLDISFVGSNRISILQFSSFLRFSL
ncbi:hypothetical protein SK629_0833 [Streptococcus mitis]|uniref:Uncharacterized protein n=1 Tax=Streptococcus mitis TaxID=28037 RepID=A0A081PXA2_STRMT|nr:hypothetical protein SK629_0833 [Streptococcus mitis]